MSDLPQKTAFSSDLLVTFGLPLWQQSSSQVWAALETEQAEVVEAVATITPVEPSLNSSQSHRPPVSSSMEVVEKEAVSESVAVPAVESLVEVTPVDSIRFVLIGDGLSRIWQNPETSEWHLLLAILKAFQLDDAQLKVFDTAHLETEDATFETMDQIIELGLDVVFAFDENSVLLDYLQEGIHVERMPSLTEMLVQPPLKRACYQQLQTYFL